MFEPAGSDADLRLAHTQAIIDDGLQAGAAGLAGAKEALASAHDGDAEAVTSAERKARQALNSFAHALNWAEDGPRETEVHQRMDEAGRWVRSTFGCVLDQNDRTYYISCPVRLGHTRIGMSVGGAARRICSLCGQDVSECEHDRGTAYWVPGGVDDLGWCRVCRGEQCTDHSPDERYRVGVVSIIREMDLVEVSYVSKPAQPDARIQRRSVDTADLQAALGPDWAPGVPVNCDFCLTPCEGLYRPDLSTHS